MLKDLTITLAQLNPKMGDIKGNAQKVIEVWQSSESDLVLFPELFLCGYPPEDLCRNTSFITALKIEVDHIVQQSSAFKAAAIVPTIWEEGENIYNAALLIENGEIKHIFKKHHLPNYSVFDEIRNFESAPLPEPIEFRGSKLGIMICEDMWITDLPTHLKNKGAELLIAVNASPYHITKHERRMDVANACYEKTGLPLVYLNIIGGQDELVFDGRSFVMDAKGKIVFEGASFKEEITNVTIGGLVTAQTVESFAQKTFGYDLYDALVTGTREYIHKNGFKNVLIGLSGGIDSAIVAAIAVDALGAENVHCVMLPSEFTSNDSLEDAKSCAEILGVQYISIPIKNAVKTFEGMIPGLSGLAHENTQSRIRGTTLMAMSNATGAMLLTTGNKSEMAVGYCTIYGDMNGGYNPIKDIYKTKVYELAAWRNTVSQVIPERIITKAPSAELRPDQTDQDSLPPYDVLDDILYALIECDESGVSAEHQSRLNTYPRETIEKVARLLQISEYKRYQAPPGVRVSTKAFGRDRRYPMSNHYANRLEKS